MLKTFAVVDQRSHIKTLPILIGIVLSLLFMSAAIAHGVDANTKQFLQANQGVAIGPFLYIGAKHMVTGYDHLLFLFGVIFFLFGTRDIIRYVSLFTLGHSLTLFFGVLVGVEVNAYIIDAIIGLSVVYKGFDNLGGFQRLFGVQPNTQAAVLIFGLFHGLGLATKLQDFALPQQDLWKNLLAFNIGVEIGQLLALFIILLLLNSWRRFNSYYHFAVLSNTLLITGGLILFGYQIAGFLLGGSSL
ncbi:MAG: HupE/UreJ family protein [Methyloprofundus sp.]|nr:HupE/UreJ family protein [Methyloprofundus sp.]